MSARWTRTDRILCDLDEHPWSTAAEVGQRLGLTDRRVPAAHLADLVRHGRAQRADGYRIRYALPGVALPPDMEPPEREPTGLAVPLLDALRQSPWLTVDELVERLNAKSSAVKSALYRVADRLVSRPVRDGAMGRPRLQYALAADSEAA